jgi:DNA anti-recombination protein RmuC
MSGNESKCNEPKCNDTQLNTLINLTKELKKQMQEQMELIKELKEENKTIRENTTKMGNHIDFINNTYEKLTKSYLFRNIFA